MPHVGCAKRGDWRCGDGGTSIVVCGWVEGSQLQGVFEADCGFPCAARSSKRTQPSQCMGAGRPARPPAPTLDALTAAPCVPL